MCPKCGVDTIITNSYTLVEGDNSPNDVTKVYTVQECKCINPKCSEYGNIVEQKKHIIFEGGAVD